MKILANLILVYSSLLQFQELQAMSTNNPIVNESTCAKQFGDTIPPVANCVTGSITFSLPISGCILIWARDLDRGSIDDITAPNKLKFYLNGNRNMENMQICCRDFFASGACDEYIVNFDIWVEDEAGNTSICKTTVIIQDDLDACTCQSSGFSLKGFIGNTCNYRSEANLKLSGPNNYYRESSGPFIRFYELLNGLYHLCLERTDNPLNGVSTADIVKIQRHILGIETFNNYIQLLAADVNNSSTITTADVSEIRKLILGVKTQFSKVNSWVFVPSDSLINPKHIIHVNDFKTGCWDLTINNASIDSIHFTSIKMGDVTCSAKLTGKDKTISRNSNTPFILKYYSSRLDEQLINTSLYLDNNSEIQGFQFTLEFDPALFEFNKIESGDITILDDQISFRDIDKGKIHIACDINQMRRSLSFTGKLFSILWKQKSIAFTFPFLNFDLNGIKPLLIDEKLNEYDLVLRNYVQSPFSNLKAYAHFGNQTIQLVGKIAKESNASYCIIDILGQVIFQKSILLNEGTLHESISLPNLPRNSMYFFKIQSGQYSKSWKFLNLK